ncbi:hypothetical protein LJC46_05670 [Desulfovibrio sp. OttesenSCG-928-G15]|nr:hypothetical protein [Desulfovibrio sp. OttesenSCG-928-G15]
MNVDGIVSRGLVSGNTSITAVAADITACWGDYFNGFSRRSQTWNEDQANQQPDPTKIQFTAPVMPDTFFSPIHPSSNEIMAMGNRVFSYKNNTTHEVYTSRKYKSATKQALCDIFFAQGLHEFVSFYEITV